MKYLLALLFLFGCKEEQKLDVVAKVDLQRYLGTWYEIARLPAKFENGCVGVTATYSLNEDGTIKVVNRCRLHKLDGELKEATGIARVCDLNTNAKLKVQFFWPFSGDYWIIELANDYSYAVVGTPNRQYMWVLSRTPFMENALYNQIIERARAKGFDVDKLEKPVQINL